ncbi:unnamed protein product [Thelazia callipaeda]|uniref:Ovule protein n=1 Tax=Thelazia callipaeda TaxID=103827 RepID=A0A0N5CSZ2_THECL|nr:unnamed protein product [Thelazia callipaeda]
MSRIQILNTVMMRIQSCCFVCGTSRNWWSSPARSDSPYIDHSFIHAFSLWGMCRECGLCHPNELKVIGVKTNPTKPFAIKISDSMMLAFLGFKTPNDAKI